jgi:deazaflavin-dependent oxidoreductase (nitroreductase family)
MIETTLPLAPERWAMVPGGTEEVLPMAHYRQPDWFTRNVFNGLVAGLTRLGISVWGSRILRVRGRQSGRWYSTPVNLLTYEGQRYLVAPRGNTQWVRNLRAAGGGELALGSVVESFRATELPDDAKPPLLRAYLQRWQFEVGAFFDGVRASSPDEDLRNIAPAHPVFQILPPA